MSQTRKSLNSIASGEQYRNLVAAVEKGDYEAIASSYAEISRLVEEAEKEIAQKIQNLPRLNKNDDYQKFRSAFVLRARATLPEWHRLNSELQKQKVMDGVVFGFGTKGDPLVRTPEGRIVVVSGAKLKEGDKVRFKVVAEGQKLDFGRPFELTADSFYFVLSQDVRQKIRDTLASIRERASAMERNGFADLSPILKELEDVRELASGLQAEEKERVAAQVQAQRRKLLESSVIRVIFDFISREEEREISESCRGELLPGAAPGLFDRQAYEALRAGLFAGEDIRGYSEAVERLEDKVDSMDSAVQLLDFKESIDKMVPPAKRYLDRMDRLFDRLSVRARECALKIAEDKVCDTAYVNSVIAQDFSGANLCSEIRRVFRSTEDFFELREAVAELRSRLLGDEAVRAEAAIKPYLRQKLALAFGKKVELPAA